MLVNQIEDDLYLLIGETYQSQCHRIRFRGQVLLRNAMGSGADAEKLRDYVETELQKEVRFIVCTHFFADHMAALNLFPQANVIAIKIIWALLILNSTDRKRKRLISASLTF